MAKYTKQTVTAEHMRIAASYATDAQAAFSLGMRCLATFQRMETDAGLAAAMRALFGDNLALWQEMVEDEDLQRLIAKFEKNVEWQKLLDVYQEVSDGD